MDKSSLVLVIGGLAAGAVCLRPRDVWPMLINLALIAGGTLALLWWVSNPLEANALQEGAKEVGTNVSTKILIFLACQPLVFLAARGLGKLLAKLDNPARKT